MYCTYQIFFFSQKKESVKTHSFFNYSPTIFTFAFRPSANIEDLDNRQSLTND